jgi:hypothetical protein
MISIKRGARSAMAACLSRSGKVSSILTADAEYGEHCVGSTGQMGWRRHGDGLQGPHAIRAVSVTLLTLTCVNLVSPGASKMLSSLAFVSSALVVVCLFARTAPPTQQTSASVLSASSVTWTSLLTIAFIAGVSRSGARTGGAYPSSDGGIRAESFLGGMPGHVFGLEVEMKRAASGKPAGEIGDLDRSPYREVVKARAQAPAIETGRQLARGQTLNQTTWSAADDGSGSGRSLVSVPHVKRLALSAVEGQGKAPAAGAAVKTSGDGDEGGRGGQAAGTGEEYTVAAAASAHVGNPESAVGAEDKGEMSMAPVTVGPDPSSSLSAELAGAGAGVPAGDDGVGSVLHANGGGEESDSDGGGDVRAGHSGRADESENAVGGGNNDDEDEHSER